MIKIKRPLLFVPYFEYQFAKAEIVFHLEMSINFRNKICIWNPAKSSQTGTQDDLLWYGGSMNYTLTSLFSTSASQTIPVQFKLFYLHSIILEIYRVSRYICGSFVKWNSWQNFLSWEICLVLIMTWDTGINWWNLLMAKIISVAEYFSLR